MATLLKGSQIVKELNLEIKSSVEELKNQGISPKIVIMLAGDNYGSKMYADMIVKNCQKNGIVAHLDNYNKEIDADIFYNALNSHNMDKDTHGIIVMLPLPKQLSESKIQNLINPQKDIDGIHPLNAGNLLAGNAALAPSTAQACRDLLYYSKIETSGKSVVIVGRSNIVGKPLAAIMMQKDVGANATVTVCHSRTENLSEVCSRADILVAAIGSANFISEKFVNPNSVVIDVGMNELMLPDGSTRLCGDVDFDKVEPIVKAITPVPGGVSPLTHTALQNNLLKAISMQKQLKQQL